MLRPDKEGYYIIDSKDKLEQWYALTKQPKPEVVVKVKTKPKTKKKLTKQTKEEKTLNKFFG